MKQYFLEKNVWNGGVLLDDDMFRKIVQPSFEYISLPEPDKLYLPLKENGQEACKAAVCVGQYVEPYGIVGVREGRYIQDYHVVRTDLPGYVESIKRECTGYQKFEEYVELQVYRKKYHHAVYFPCDEKANEQTEKILMTSGIPGINRIVFDGDSRRKCQTIIFNTVIDDPSLFYNELMMKERPGQILYGLLIFLHILKAEEIFIVADKRQQSGMSVFIETAKKYFTKEIEDRISVIYVSDLYPGGKDELLIQNLTVWIQERTWVMVHMDEVLGAYDVIYDHKPWTRRRFLAGGCMAGNGYYELPIGMRLREVIDRKQENLWGQRSRILVDGGLMAGRTVNPENAVVRSDMNSLLILPRVEEKEQLCQSCGSCGRACPGGIILGCGKVQDFEKCMGCGSCSYICPSRRRLKEFIKRGCYQQKNNRKGGNYIELPPDCGLFQAVVTGYSSPYIRQAQSPFTCILSPFKL